jgi:hypothetical protein
MKRIFKDYRNITDKHMLLIREKYPKGFSDSDFISIKTSDGDYMNVLEIPSLESLYLIRINHDLLSLIDDFNESLDFSDELEPTSDKENED